VVEQNLIQKVSQSLIISKQMQQSLKILQMSSLDLNEYLNTEIENNPFIEKLESDDYDKHLSNSNDNELNESSNQWQEESYSRYEKTSSGLDDNYIENLDLTKPSLKSALVEQINIEINNPKEKFIALFITDLLDDNGYLTEKLESIAQQLQCDIGLIKAVLNKLYTLEPIGAYAIDLKDCLLIQLNEKKLLNNQFKKLVENLELIPKGEIKKLSKICVIDINDITEYIKVIQTLDPKPGRKYDKEPIKTLIPDVFIKKNSKNELIAILNNNSFPKININEKYFKYIAQHTKTIQEKKYCSEKMHNANWLIKAINQRAETILKVANQIIIEQYEFFEKGINYLKPMTLNTIAKQLNLHESTISRISNKVLSTPFGTFEIKYFFNSALSSTYSENMVSTLSIKQKIKELVENENPKKILSDEDICELIKEQGTNIARRTVAKYRQILNIPSSSERKRLKSISIINKCA
jgi:RNA polymerase sigma-54 factor